MQSACDLRFWEYWIPANDGAAIFIGTPLRENPMLVRG